MAGKGVNVIFDLDGTAAVAFYRKRYASLGYLENAVYPGRQLRLPFFLRPTHAP